MARFQCAGAMGKARVQMGQHVNDSRRPGKVSRWRARLAGIVALILIATIAWYWRPLKADALADASYASRIACSCRYVAGRDLSDCRKDFLPGMGFIMLSEDEGAKRVTARSLLLSSQTATFHDGQGCVLEPASR